MSLAQWIPALLLLGFALASMFFALAESALFTLGKWQIRGLVERSPVQGKQVQMLLESPQDLLATLVLGTTLAHSAMILVCVMAIILGVWPFQLGYAIGILLILALLFCEVYPKTIAVREPEKWSLRVASPLNAFRRLVQPINERAHQLNQAILKRLVPQSVQPNQLISDEEIEELFEIGYQQGALKFEEKEIILEIIDLENQSAGDVMTPRASMKCVSRLLNRDQMIAAARKYKHRRLPVYDGGYDRIVGVLNTKTMLLNPDQDLEAMTEPPSFVPESMNLLDLFKSLQRDQRGMAIVLDEYGSTTGIVTMEDVLEVVVGEIRNEGEVQEFILEKIHPGKWRVNPRMRIEDFQREYPEIGEVEEVDTMGGLVLSLLSVIPQPGESVSYRGLQFVVTRADERKIRELVVERIKPVKGG